MKCFNRFDAFQAFETGLPFNLPRNTKLTPRR
jgi:hypothetical protein